MCVAGRWHARPTKHNAIIAQEHIGNRLSLITNDAGVIESARCG